VFANTLGSHVFCDQILIISLFLLQVWIGIYGRYTKLNITLDVTLEQTGFAALAWQGCAVPHASVQQLQHRYIQNSQWQYACIQQSHAPCLLILFKAWRTCQFLCQMARMLLLR
jgi:hypothetical protein